MKNESSDDYTALVSLIENGVGCYVPGVDDRGEKGWWSVVRKWVKGGLPAEKFAEKGPFNTRAEAEETAKTWGSTKVETWTLLDLAYRSVLRVLPPDLVPGPAPGTPATVPRRYTWPPVRDGGSAPGQRGGA